MGFFSRTPLSVRRGGVAALSALALLGGGYLFFADNSSPGTVALPPATFIPSDRSLTGNPDAVLKKKDLETAFNAVFRQYQENPIGAMGVQYNFTETHGTFTMSVFEVKGQEAENAWRRLTTEFTYADAPNIGPRAKFRPELVVAVYEREVFLSVTLTGGNPPTDGKALQALGKQAVAKIRLMSR